MNEVVDLVMQAFPTGTPLIEAAIIAVISALLMGRLVLVLIWAAIAVVIDTLLPVIYNIVSNGNTSEVSSTFSTILSEVQADYKLLIVKYVGYLVAIGILFLLKSLVFRRG